MDHPLRRYRASHGITIEALAASLDTSKATVSRLETGRQSPSMDLLRRIHTATGGEVTANDFLHPDNARAA